MAERIARGSSARAQAEHRFQFVMAVKAAECMPVRGPNHGEKAARPACQLYRFLRTSSGRNPAERRK